MDKHPHNQAQKPRQPQGYSKDAAAPDAVPNTKIAAPAPIAAPLKAPSIDNVNLEPGEEGDTTQLIAKPKGVRIRANAAIAYEGITLGPGDEAEVSEEMAAEFCDRKFQGAYAFGGERGNGSAERHVHARATRLS